MDIKFSRNTHLIETSYDRLKSREITFQQYREIFAKARFSDGLQISMNIKYYYAFINSLLFTEHSELFTNLTPIITSRLLPCQHRGVGIMQYVYALNPVCASF